MNVSHPVCLVPIECSLNVLCVKDNEMNVVDVDNVKQENENEKKTKRRLRCEKKSNKPLNSFT